MKKRVLILSTLLFSALLAEDNNLFIGANAGVSHYDYSKKNIVSSVDISSLDTSAFLIDLDVGYKFTNNIFMTLNYQMVNFSETNFRNYYSFYTATKKYNSLHVF